MNQLNTMHVKWRQLSAIASVTFREFVRDRVFIGVFIISLSVVIVGILASLASFMQPDRIILNFGLSAVLISGLFMGVTLGAGMLQKEFDKRTLSVILSRPVSSFTFITGKFSGLALALFCSWGLLNLILFATLFLYGMKPSAYLHLSLVYAIFFALIQSFVASAIAIFFSSFATVPVSTVIGFGLFLVGANALQIEKLGQQSKWGGEFLLILSKVVPRYELFHLGGGAIYGFDVPSHYLIKVMAYSFTLIILSLLGSSVILLRKEVK